MNKTNFDLYLEEQLKDPVFTERSSVVWNRLLTKVTRSACFAA